MGGRKLARYSASAVLAGREKDGDRLLEPELLDRDDLALGVRLRALLDLRRVNLITLGRWAVVRVLDGRLGGGCVEATILELAAGAGDSGAALRRWAARRGCRIKVVALDRKLSHVLLGRRLGEIETAVVGRAESLPFRKGAFDWSLASLFFHHLDDEGKLLVLDEMRWVTRESAVIVDLRPSVWVAMAVRLLLPLLAVGRVNRVDGRLSVRRSLDLGEWQALLSGVGAHEVGKCFPARIFAVVSGRGGSAVEGRNQTRGGEPAVPDREPSQDPAGRTGRAPGSR